MVSKRGGPAERVEARAALTAVLLADSFTQRFRPITIEQPKALLPLVNVPLMEYALEWLAMNRVEEVYLFCCAHAENIKQYISSSKWAHSKEMKVVPIVSTNCLSAGEALRVIDQRDLIKSDFILCNADTVANVALAPILEAHRARRAADKNAIMTMLMKPVSHPAQRVRLGDTDLVVTLDPATQRLLKYTELDVGRAATAKLDCAFFSERDEVQVRSDLLDTDIYICAPEVLVLFSDNFDYQNIRRDFVVGVLSEEELGNKLYVHQVQHEYAARVHNLRSYDAISRDIMERWAFPLVPDTNMLWLGGTWGQASYRYSRGQRYLEANVTVARSALIGEDVAIGAGTSIGDGSRVAQSVLGRNVRVGRGCDIVGSYVQEGAVIQDGASLHCALVCEGAVLRPGCFVGPGSIISYGCVVDAKHDVPPHTRISLCRQLHKAGNDSDDELEYSAAGGPGSGPKSLSHLHSAAASGRGRDSGDGSGDGDSSFLDADSLGKSMERPSAGALRAAQALAAGQPAGAAEGSGDGDYEDPGVSFDASAVGLGGAGYRWDPKEQAGLLDFERSSIAPPSLSSLTAYQKAASGEGVKVEEQGHGGEPGASGAGVADEGSEGGSHDDDSGSSDDDDGRTGGGETAEHVWRREVQETFLRCIKERFEVNNVIVELNSLKIAENRSFADIARYMFTTLLGLGLPAPRRTTPEYVPLFKHAAPDTSTKAGKAQLVNTFKQHLRDWQSLLQRFLRIEDDQVDLLLTLEEYCNCEGVFEVDGTAGACYAPVFAFLLRELYESDVVSEDAIFCWAQEKQHAEGEERRYLDDPDVAKVLEWLQDDDEEDDEGEDEEGDEDEEDED